MGVLAMGDDTRALIGRLFAEATAIIEDAHEITIQGQSPKSSINAKAGAAAGLRTVLEDAAILVQAVLVLARREEHRRH